MFECTGTCLLRSEIFPGFGLCLRLHWGRQGLSCFCCYMLHCLLRPLALSFWTTLWSPPHALPHKYWDYRSPPSHLAFVCSHCYLTGSLYAALAGQNPTLTPSCPWLASEMGLASASHKSWRSNSNRETCVYSYPFYQMSHLSSCFKVLVLIILVISLKIILIILL